jgi:hypothetical protein
MPLNNTSMAFTLTKGEEEFLKRCSMALIIVGRNASRSLFTAITVAKRIRFGQTVVSSPRAIKLSLKTFGGV